MRVCVVGASFISACGARTGLDVPEIEDAGVRDYVDVVVHDGDMGVVSHACNDPSSTWASVTIGASPCWAQATLTTQ